MIKFVCDWCAEEAPYDEVAGHIFRLESPTPDGPELSHYCSPVCAVASLRDDWDIDEPETAKNDGAQAAPAMAKLNKFMREVGESMPKDRIDYQPEGQAAVLEGLSAKEIDEITGVTRK